MINNSSSNRWVEQINEMRNDMLRKKFGKYIKQNSMIRLKEEIKRSDEFNSLLFHCYDLQPNPIVAMGIDDVDYDICLNLAMIYWYENLFLSDEVKSAKLKDKDYTEYLKEKVIFQCRLRKLLQSFGKSNNFLAYTPLNYSIHCVVNYILLKLDENLRRRIQPNGGNGDFKINTLIVLLKNIKSILLLTESDNCGSAFSLLRMLIEATCVYLTVGDNKELANEYYKFMQYRLDFEMNGEYPTKFTEKAPKDCSWQNYLNYGWMDLLDNKKRKYKFSELVDYIKIDNATLKQHFLEIYKYCCKFSHGNFLNQSIGAYDFIWVLGRVGLILVELANDYTQLFNDEIKYNGVDLVDWLKKETIESFKIYQRQTAEGDTTSL